MNMKQPEAAGGLADSFDFIISTIPSDYRLTDYAKLLKYGTGELAVGHREGRLGVVCRVWAVQGYRDLLHIIQEIAARYCKNPVIRIRPGSAGARGGPYTVKKPIQWAIWNDTKAHPYYLGAVEFQLEIPTICPEVPFT